MKHQRHLSGTPPRRLSGTCPRRPISTSLLRLLYFPNEIPNDIPVVRLYHVSELRCRDVSATVSAMFSNYVS